MNKESSNSSGDTIVGCGCIMACLIAFLAFIVLAILCPQVAILLLL